MTNARFLLEEDGKPVWPVFDTLQEAQEEGERRVARRLSLLVTMMAAPAPCYGWRYDYEVSDWVNTTLP